MEDNNKFINAETEGFLQSQLGMTHNQRIADLETNIENTVKYLKEVEVYLGDFEKYHQASLQRIEATKVEDRANTASFQETIQTQIDRIKDQVRLTLYIAITAGSVAAGIGAALWLIK